MKRFDFSQTGGFPLTQDRLKWMQEGYIEAINALGSLQGTTGSCVVVGVELTSGSWGGTGTVSDGWIYSGDWGLLPFIGGEFTPSKSNVIFAEDVFPNPPNPLMYESNAAHNVQIRRVARIGNGASNNLRNLSQTRWGAKFGAENRTDWIDCQITGGAGSVKVMHDKLTGMARIRGHINRQTYYLNVSNNGFPWVECALIPTTGILPTDDIYFTTTLPEPVKDIQGNLHVNANGRLDTSQVIVSSGGGATSAMRLLLQAIQPIPQVGVQANNWTQYFDFSYKI